MATKQRDARDPKRMDQYFAVFNLHVNKAGERADREFVAQWGQKRYDRHIQPYRSDGIMAIFGRKPNQWQLIWVSLVTAFVNEVTTRRKTKEVA